MIRCFIAIATLVVLSVVATPGFAAADTSMGYCVEQMETRQATCFDTERELITYQDQAALRPLVTMFRDANYVGAGGYRNYVSAYGKDRCDYSQSVREASSGNLEFDRFSTGQIMNDQVSSFVIRADSFCVVYLYEHAGFKSGIVGQKTTSCPDMRNCVGNGVVTIPFNDVLSSFGVS
jgi:hypothetical protein